MVQAAKRIAILFIFLRRYYPYQVLGYVLSSTRRHRGSAHRAPLLFSGCKDIVFFFAVQDCEGLLPILLAFTEYVRSCRSCCKCHSIMQITARRVSLIIRELRGTSARGEAKLVSPRDLVKCKCLTNNDLCFTSSRGEFQKFYCPVEFPYCIFVRNILLLRFSGPKSEHYPLFCFSHFLM